MVTCKGFKTNGDRCGTWLGLSRDGYCRWHMPTNLCRGKHRDGMPCMAPKKPDYDYCCAAHDPALYYVSPCIFGRDNVRTEKIGIVAEYCHGRDLYHDEKLDRMKLHTYQVDHILEKQSFAFVTIQAGITKKSDQEWVATFIRDKIANRTKNLCLTRTETYKMKGQACFKFLDDYVTGHRARSDGVTLDTYLKKEMVNGERLQRSTTENIRKAMGKKIKFSQRKLAEESDSPELERISIELQKLYLDMDLKVRLTEQDHRNQASSFM